jgi:hypothetical protein
MDDFDIEIAPLRRATADDQADERVDAHGERSPTAPRLSPRGRALRLGGILGALLTAVAVLVAVTPGARSAVVGFVIGPTPTATQTLDGGRDAFAVEDQVPWGRLTIDGHPGPQLYPAQSVTQFTLPQLATFVLARGRHQVEYRADPFPTVRCTLSVPAAPGDTCPIDPQVIDYLVTTGRFTRLLDLGATVDRLPAEEALALAHATQRALDDAAAGAGGTLLPGDHYADADGRVTTASEALIADPTYTLLGDAPALPNGRCAILCSDGAPLAQSSSDAWLVYAAVDLSWRYRDGSGHVVLADGPPGQPEAAWPASLQVGVRRVGGTWQVRVIDVLSSGSSVRDPLTCPMGAHYLDVLRATPDQTTVPLSDSSYQWPTSSSSPALGCVFGGQRIDTQGTPTGPVALVLYRCGVLTAVNDEALADFPHLSRASPHETALALAAWPPTDATRGPPG